MGIKSRFGLYQRLLAYILIELFLLLPILRQKWNWDPILFMALLSLLAGMTFDVAAILRQMKSRTPEVPISN